MGGLSRVQLLMAVVVGGGIVAVGFLAGLGIGNGEDSSSPGAQGPARIATRDSAVDIPTLGEAKQIPKLEVKEQPVTSTVEEGTDSTFTPSFAEESESEGEPAEEKVPSGTVPAVPETRPEVTVAPNG